MDTPAPGADAAAADADVGGTGAAVGDAGGGDGDLLARLDALDDAGLGAVLCATVARLGDAGQRVAVARAAVGDLGDPCDTDGLVALAAAAAARVHGGHRAQLAAALVAGL